VRSNAITASVSHPRWLRGTQIDRLLLISYFRNSLEAEYADGAKAMPRTPESWLMSIYLPHSLERKILTCGMSMYDTAKPQVPDH
jgi:hypothetical protein